MKPLKGNRVLTRPARMGVSPRQPVLVVGELRGAATSVGRTHPVTCGGRSQRRVRGLRRLYSGTRCEYGGVGNCDAGRRLASPRLLSGVGMHCRGWEEVFLGDCLIQIRSQPFEPWVRGSGFDQSGGRHDGQRGSKDEITF